MPSSSSRPELARWRWAITAAFGLGGITVSAWGPQLPAIKAGLDIGTATIGLLLAGVTVGAILGLLASTPVLHWLGSRRAVAGAILLIAAAMTVMGLALVADSVPLVAIAFVVTGTGVGTLDVLINVEGAAVRAGRRAHPHAEHARCLVHRRRRGVGDRCGLRRPQHLSRGAASSVRPSSSPSPPSGWLRQSRPGIARQPSRRRGTGERSSASGCAAG